MKMKWAGAAIGLALLGVLGGCAAPTTGVSVAAAAGGFGADGRTYVFARTEAQDGKAAYAQVEQQVRDELARQGYREQADAARYRLAIAYATQPADVALGGAVERADGTAASTAGLRVDGSAPFPLPFADPVYRHLLTLQFVDRHSGTIAYQVTSAVRDRNADPLAALPTLVRGALAKLPFEAAGGWIVKTRPGEAGAAPRVVSVKPAEAR